MKIHSYGKKLMAVACAVVMLVSCMVFAPVSAESKVVLQTDYTTNSDKLTTWYETIYQGALSNRTVAADGSAKVTYDSEAEGHDSKGVMTFQWENNRVADEKGEFDRSQIGYRISADGSGEKLVKDKYYTAEFFYKVEKLTENAELRFFVGGQNWAGGAARSNLINSYEANYGKIDIKPTEEAQDWQKASFVFKVDSGNAAMHLSVTINEVANWAGSKVLIDDMTITLLDSAATVTFDGNGGTASTDKADGVTGTAITATATRDGYDFIGWYTAAYGGEKVTAIPSSNTTLYAHWALSAEHTWSMENETVGADLALTNSYGNTVTVMEDAAVADGQFIKVSAQNTDGSRIPQVLVKDDTGAYVRTEKGKKYRVTFKYYASTGLTGMGFWLASTPDQPTAAFEGTDGDSTSKRGHVLALLYADIQLSNAQTANRDSGDTKYREVSKWSFAPIATEKWIETSVIVSHDIADESGYLRLGITTNYADGYGDTARCIYLDDIIVSEYTAEENFLNPLYNVSAKQTTLSEYAVADGAFANHVYFEDSNGTSSDATALPMLLLDKNGDYVQVDAGKKYLLQWRVFIPEGATTATKLTVWAGAGSDPFKVPANWQEAGNLRLLSETKSVDALGKWVTMSLTFTPTEAKSGYLRLCLRTDNANKTGTVDAYFDDVQLIELENSIAFGDAAYNCYVVPTDKYSHDGAQSYVAVSGSTGGDGRTQFLLRDENGQPIQIKKDQRYLVSFWAYAPLANQNALRYWLAAADQETAFRAKSADGQDPGYLKNTYLLKYLDDNGDLKNAENNLSNSRGAWQPVSLTVVGQRDGENYLRLGICPASDQNTYEPFYISGISVLSIDDALGKVSDNVGVYKNDGNSYYEQDGIKYGALRLLGGYTVADGDATKAVIGGTTYTVKERGILFSRTNQDNLTDGMEGVEKTSKKENFDSYWKMDGDVLKYSLLVKKISSNSVNKIMSFRPYIVVTDDAGTEYTLYGTTVKDISWLAAAKGANMDTTWAETQNG